MQFCTYHSLPTDDFTVASTGKCQDCGQETSIDAVIRCEACSTKSQLCMCCSQELKYDKTIATWAILKSKNDTLDRYYLDTPENHKVYEDLLKGIENDKYPTLEALLEDYDVIYGNIQDQIFSEMNKLDD